MIGCCLTPLGSMVLKITRDELPMEQGVYGGMPSLSPLYSLVRNGMANLASSKAGMAIVPIKVTYAFLNNGSASTFCAESLMKQQGVSGSRDQISSTTLEKKYSVIGCFVVKGLTIYDLGKKVRLYRAASNVYENRNTCFKRGYTHPERCRPMATLEWSLPTRS